MSARIISKDEIRGLLSQTSWRVNDLFDHAAPPKCLPTEDELNKLAELADIGECNTESFRNQLRFIETLRDVDTRGISPVTELTENKL